MEQYPGHTGLCIWGHYRSGNFIVPAQHLKRAGYSTCNEMNQNNRKYFCPARPVISPLCVVRLPTKLCIYNNLLIVPIFSGWMDSFIKLLNTFYRKSQFEVIINDLGKKTVSNTK